MWWIVVFMLIEFRLGGLTRHLLLRRGEGGHGSFRGIRLLRFPFRVRVLVVMFRRISVIQRS